MEEEGRRGGGGHDAFPEMRHLLKVAKFGGDFRADSERLDDGTYKTLYISPDSAVPHSLDSADECKFVPPHPTSALFSKYSYLFGTVQFSFLFFLLFFFCLVVFDNICI